MIKKSLLGGRSVVLGALLSLGVTACAGDVPESEDDGEAAIEALFAPVGPKVYIVEVAAGHDVDATIDELRDRHGLGVTHRYRHVMRGGALLVPNDTVRAKLASDPRIVRIEPDRAIYAIGKPGGGSQPAQSLPTGYRLIGADVTANEGTGVRVAVLDTGVDLTHPDLEANLDPTYSKDCINEGGAAQGDDKNGHGSHVAGTIAATNNSIGSIGVGTGIKIVPVKVLNRNGSGSWSSIICGVDYVTANAGAIKVANMSLGGSGTECSDSSCTKSALQVAVEKSVAAGVTYLVAAGNDGDNAANHVPASYDVVVTVSAYKDANGTLSSDDGWPSWTNYGDDVDIAAPGTGIYSTWKDGGYNTISGTSMATPHVAGAAALYLATHPGASPDQVKSALLGSAISSYPGSTDPLHKEPLLDVRTF